MCSLPVSTDSLKAICVEDGGAWHVPHDKHRAYSRNERACYDNNLKRDASKSSADMAFRRALSRAVVCDDDAYSREHLNDSCKAREAHKTLHAEQREHKAGKRREQPAQLEMPLCLLRDDVAHV